jgi:ATP-dependent DNA helicase RecG
LKFNKAQISKLIEDLESELVERTISASDTDKYAQAICAFSNDLGGTGQKGFLLIGVHDNGDFSEFKATDRFLQNLGLETK